MNNCAEGVERRRNGFPEREPLPELNEVDGDSNSDIAICGFSAKFPDDATSADGFWQMMLDKRCATSRLPDDRMNQNGRSTASRGGQPWANIGGHFIKEDLAVFNADFFSISPAEAAAMDPMQRWLLETAYRALENAGITMESVSNSATGVYSGSFANDYMLQLARDPENTPKFAAQGFGLSMLSNRISWFFNLHGPSVSLDSACSSAATAVDVACQALSNGTCNMALVAGCNIARAPEGYIWLDTSSFLSPDSRCYSFDHRGNGYARGEGIAVLVLKRVSDAIRDDNTIRAVIRSVGSNEDGKTPGITQPSQEAQERLIRETYAKAGLSRHHTRFFEAHGTGTKIGDPREAKSIGYVFREFRSDSDPIYLGAVKSNIGHLEGGSGLAGVIKTVLVLEKAVIPPNTNFEKLNPRIDAEFLRLKFPQKAYPWPTSGLRRASINSSGFGGSNTHVIIDDAYNYLRLRGLQAKHSSVASPPTTEFCNKSSTQSQVKESRTETTGDTSRLLVWSAADKDGLHRVTEAYREWMGNSDRKAGLLDAPETFMTNLSFTLDAHRSRLPWRAYALLKSPAELFHLHSLISIPVRAQTELPRLGFVFSGQGGQWHAMGRELLLYPSFKEDVLRAGDFLRSLGCPWSAIDELCQPAEKSRLEEAEFGQSLSTILQVATVNLLRRFDIRPAAVVGHSSGEIAAAYACNGIDEESAWRLAYFRGFLSAYLARTSKVKGTMISVGTSEEQARELIASLIAELSSESLGLHIACINSPANVTISGEERLVDALKKRLDDHNLFARKLRVPLAYHSPQIQAISDEYVSLIGSLNAPGDRKASSHHPPMLSSVLGQRVDASKLLDPWYWVESIVRPVQFSRALSLMCHQSPSWLAKKIDNNHVSEPAIDHLVEIGPHSTLQGPIRETIRKSSRETSVGYSSILQRGKSARDTMLQALGELYSIGLLLSLTRANKVGKGTSSPTLLVNLPEYPFDHSQRFWHETRLSRNYRLRSIPPSEFVGVRSRDWNSSDARWQHFLRVSESPWIEDHVINGRTLYPGAGMLAMAVEAAKQLALETCERKLHGFTLRDVCFENAIDLSSNNDIPEVQTSLRKLSPENPDSLHFAFVIRTHNGSEWISNCSGFIHVEFEESHNEWIRQRLDAQKRRTAKKLHDLLSSCGTPVSSQKMYYFLRQVGYRYGRSFRLASAQHCNEHKQQATSKVSLSETSKGDQVFHPSSLDAMLHLCFTAFSAGGTSPMATSVPSHIRCIWISHDGLCWRPGRDTVTACTHVTGLTMRGFECGGGALDKDRTRGLVLWYEGLQLTSVAQISSSLSIPNPKQWYMKTECKVGIGLLSNVEVRALLNERHPAEQAPVDFFNDLGVLVKTSLERLVGACGPSCAVGVGDWKSKYWEWAKDYLAVRRLKETTKSGQSCVPNSIDERQLENLVSRLGQISHVGRVYAEVASHLVSFLNDERDPVELLVRSGLMGDFFSVISGYRCAKQASTFLDLLAHEKPGLNILEVGGGTGATSRKLVRVLQSGESGLRCGHYDFSDKSLILNEKNRQQFLSYGAHFRLKTLDIERDPISQGFETGAYDVIVADNVIHTASDLAQTLQNIRTLLKSGGRILIQEPLGDSDGILTFVFGLFSGWWAASGGGRSTSPVMTADAWDIALKTSGFSGIDMVLKDFEDDAAHHMGWLISTAVDRGSGSLFNGSLHILGQKFHATIVIDRNCAGHKSLVNSLLPLLEDSLGIDAQVLDIEAAARVTQRDDHEIVILLVDCGQRFLQTLDSDSFCCIKSLIKASRRLLWVFGCGAWETSPDHGLVDGLARVLRSEFYELQLVTLVLNENVNQGFNQVQHIVRVAEKMLSQDAQQAYEQEYLEIGGYLNTRRLVEASELKFAMNGKLLPYESTRTHLGGEECFELRALTLHPNDPPCFFRQETSEMPRLEMKEEAEEYASIKVAAARLQPHDRITALGQTSHAECPAPYYICVGTIRSFAGGKLAPTGSLRTGDRVFFAWNGPLCSRVSVATYSLVRLSDKVSFTEACASCPYLTAAHHALIEKGGLTDSHSILVRNGASSLGQAALHVLFMQGARNIWTTTNSQDEHNQVTRTFEIDDEHVLPDQWFLSQTTVLSQLETKFDIVLAEGSEVTRELFLNHIKPGGRHISINTGTHLNRSSHHINCAPPNISHDFFDMGRTLITAASLEFAARHVGAIARANPHLHTKFFPASEIASAFKHLQKANAEPAIIEFHDSDVVEVRTMTRPAYCFSSDATYLILGGLGGLGRSIARWIVSRGARHLVLLSRSGPKTGAAQQLLSELESQGVAVKAPCCDVSDRGVLKHVLAICAATMPPIKGCIQSSMVMIETIFEKMSFADWRTALDSKVRGSWNLHRQLPRGLDFFIPISSFMGTIGQTSLSAYSAANSYLDALARHRVSRGERATSLGLGVIADSGFLVDHGGRNAIAGFEGFERYAFMRVREICALLDIYCDPRSSNHWSKSVVDCQPVIGIRPPAHWRHLEDVPKTFSQPLWGHMHHLAPLVLEDEDDGTDLRATNNMKTQQRRSLDAAQRLSSAASVAEAADIASEALAQRTSTVLGTPEDRLDPHKAMQSYGIDSLSAINIRNWVGQVFSVDLPVFEILGGATFASAGLSIARKARLHN